MRLSSLRFSRVTKAKVNEYYEKIEAVASKIVAQVVISPETSLRLFFFSIHL